MHVKRYGWLASALLTVSESVFAHPGHAGAHVGPIHVFWGTSEVLVLAVVTAGAGAVLWRYLRKKRGFHHSKYATGTFRKN